MISCGALPTPPNGRKSTFNFLSGAEVKFDCDPGYVLLGEQRRWCYASGDWNWPEDGEATCVSKYRASSCIAGLPGCGLGWVRFDKVEWSVSGGLGLVREAEGVGGGGRLG